MATSHCTVQTFPCLAPKLSCFHSSHPVSAWGPLTSDHFLEKQHVAQIRRMSPTAGPLRMSEANFPRSAPGPRRQRLREGARKLARCTSNGRWGTHAYTLHPPVSFPYWLALPSAIPGVVPLSWYQYLLE